MIRFNIFLVRQDMIYSDDDDSDDDEELDNLSNEDNAECDDSNSGLSPPLPLLFFGSSENIYLPKTLTGSGINSICHSNKASVKDGLSNPVTSR